MYTRHGHQIPGTPEEGPAPESRARCGGVGLCSQCSKEAGREFIKTLKKEPVSVTVDHAIEVLNRINEADPMVMPMLIQLRVSCNKVLADDETVQVGLHKVGNPETGPWEVGILGIINGIFGIQENGYGYITADFDDTGKLTFIKTPPR